MELSDLNRSGGMVKQQMSIPEQTIDISGIDHLLRRAVKELTLIDHDNRIAQLQRNIQVMRRKENRFTLFPGQRSQ